MASEKLRITSRGPSPPSTRSWLLHHAVVLWVGARVGVSGYNSKAEADEAVTVASLMPIATGPSTCTRGEWLGREYLRQ